MGLYAKVKEALMTYKQSSALVETCIGKAIYLEEVTENLNKNLKYEDTQSGLTYWKDRLSQVGTKLFAFMLAKFSILIVLGELLITFNRSLSFVHHIPCGVTIMLLYMSLATYYGLFKLRVASFYKLDPSGHTDSCSLLYSARLLTGLAPPLCFNFLKLMGES